MQDEATEALRKNRPAAASSLAEQIRARGFAL